MFSCVSAGIRKKKGSYGFQMTGLNMWDVSVFFEITTIDTITQRTHGSARPCAGTRFDFTSIRDKFMSSRRSTHFSLRHAHT
jgi:hypothetical protein